MMDTFLPSIHRTLSIHCHICPDNSPPISLFTFWRGEDGEDGDGTDGEVEGEDRTAAEASYHRGEATVARDFDEGAEDHVQERVLAVKKAGKAFEIILL